MNKHNNPLVPMKDLIAAAKPGKSNRGFASMDPQRQREVAAMGGTAAHEKGTAHVFTSEEARAAGKKSHLNRRKV